MDEATADPIPLSALQHAVYCLRQCALIHLERRWEENRFTAEGQVLHQRSDRPANRREKGLRRVTGLAVASRRLGIAGRADVVEFRKDGAGEIAVPVEYKRGRAKLHRADEVQLCAQALCLEEMTDRQVQEGALFYGETRRRVAVPFDAELRSLTESTITEVAELFRRRTLPPAVYESRKCSACSLIDICRPRLSGRSALAWRNRTVVVALNSGETSDASDPQAEAAALRGGSEP